MAEENIKTEDSENQAKGIQSVKAVSYTHLDVYKRQIIDSAVCENPPLSAKDGFIIKDGYSADVDEYRRLLSDAKSIIAELETSEKQKTGIKNLKVGYNKVFGYYIEVSNYCLLYTSRCV